MHSQSAHPLGGIDQLWESWSGSGMAEEPTVLVGVQVHLLLSTTHIQPVRMHRSPSAIQNCRPPAQEPQGIIIHADARSLRIVDDPVVRTASQGRGSPPHPPRMPLRIDGSRQPWLADLRTRARAPDQIPPAVQLSRRDEGVHPDSGQRPRCRIQYPEHGRSACTCSNPGR